MATCWFVTGSSIRVFQVPLQAISVLLGHHGRLRLDFYWWTLDLQNFLPRIPGASWSNFPAPKISLFIPSFSFYSFLAPRMLLPLECPSDAASGRNTKQLPSSVFLSPGLPAWGPTCCSRLQWQILLFEFVLGKPACIVGYFQGFLPPCSPGRLFSIYCPLFNQPLILFLDWLPCFRYLLQQRENDMDPAW